MKNLQVQFYLRAFALQSRIRQHFHTLNFYFIIFIFFILITFIQHSNESPNHSKETNERNKVSILAKKKTDCHYLQMT